MKATSRPGGHEGRKDKTMKNVRKDVIEKLNSLYKARVLKNYDCKTAEYDTPRAKHYMRVLEDHIAYNTVGYDGKRYHTEVKI